MRIRIESSRKFMTIVHISIEIYSQVYFPYLLHDCILKTIKIYLFDTFRTFWFPIVSYRLFISSISKSFLYALKVYFLPRCLHSTPFFIFFLLLHIYMFLIFHLSTKNLNFVLYLMLKTWVRFPMLCKSNISNNPKKGGKWNTVQ